MTELGNICHKTGALLQNGPISITKYDRFVKNSG